MRDNQTYSDIDDIQFGRTSAEKENEVAMKLLRVSTHLSTMRSAYESSMNEILDIVTKKNGRGIKTYIPRNKDQMITAFSNLIRECDHLLCLTGKKTSMKYVQSAFTANKNSQDILDRCRAIAHGKEGISPMKLSKLEELKAMNQKFKTQQSAVTQSSITTAVKRKRDYTSTKKAKKVKVQEKDYPYIIDGDSHITIHLQPSKHVIMPNPDNSHDDRIYSMREAIQHLFIHNGKGMLNIFDCLHSHGRVAFSKATFRRQMTLYKNNGKLPEEDIMRNKSGRPRYMEIEELKNANAQISPNKSLANDATEKLQKTIKAKSQVTIRNNAFAAIMLNPDIVQIDQKSLRVVSSSREIQSRSIRTLVVEVCHAIYSSFIPGKWTSKPNTKDLPDGCKLALKLAEDLFGCEVRPIDPRYLINFDDTGRFHHKGIGSTKRTKPLVHVSKQGASHSMRGRMSLSRSATNSDAKVNDIKTKFKCVLCAFGLSSPICIEFPIFSEDELPKNHFEVVTVKGLAIGGNQSQVGYVILSRKGQKGKDGISTSELVTEWFYKNIVHQFIKDVRKGDESAKWNDGGEVPLEFRATTILDSEQSMMTILKRADIEELDREIGNMPMKIAAAATSLYQPADAGTLFAGLMETVKQSTCSTSNPPDALVKFSIALQKLREEGKLMTKANHRLNHIKDIVGVAPDAYQKVFTKKRIQNSFVRCGRASLSLADTKEIIFCPDVNRMMDNVNADWEKKRIYTCPRTKKSRECTLREFVIGQIPKAITELLDKPRISEAVLDDLGIYKDTDKSGAIIERTYTDDDYVTSRSLIVHHTKNRLRMNRALEVARTRELEKRIYHHNRQVAYINDNKACENILREVAKLPVTSPLEQLDINTFANSKVKRDLLFAFSKVRHATDLDSCDKCIPRKKGKVNDTNKTNLIHWAFACRAHPVLASPPATMTILPHEANLPLAQRISSTILQSSSSLTTSEIDTDFVRRSCIHISSLRNMSDNYGEEILSKLVWLRDGKMSQMFLLPRLASLLKKHPDVDTNHYTMKWAQSNMNRASAIMKMHGYFQSNEDLEFVRPDDSLFVRDFGYERFIVEKKMGLDEDGLSQIGSYIMIDSRRGIVIRSGATTSSFRERRNQHIQAAKLTTDASKNSRLYTSYPHPEGDINAAGWLRKGSWTDIKMVCGVRWKKEDTQKVIELFEWDDCTVNMLNRNKAKLTLHEKKEKMVVYLFETIQGLCIRPGDNISSNPSFETFNGSFSNGLA